jgi:hypothetical protein
MNSITAVPSSDHVYLCNEAQMRNIAYEISVLSVTGSDIWRDPIGGRFETDAVLFAAFIFTSVFVVFEIGKVLEQEGLVMQKYYESIRLIDMILTTVLSITLINKSDKTKNEVKPP